MKTAYPTLIDTVGNTPMVQLQRLPAAFGVPASTTVLLKLEGNNPAGSVKDRPAFSMIRRAAARGEIQAGDTLIEATSGNTGIALAMAAASLGYKMILVMPDHLSIERRQAMRAYGATLILTPQASGMEGARDHALALEARGEGKILDQFNNPDNPLAHFETTGPEIWRDTHGEITHFVSSMGTTGTIMGTGRFLKSQNTHVQILGVQPEEGAQIPGIRTWPAAYLPKIYDAQWVDHIQYVSQTAAEETMRKLAAEEGIFVGVSSGGAAWAALQLAKTLEHAVVVSIACDRGDRYLSTGVFPA